MMESEVRCRYCKSVSMISMGKIYEGPNGKRKSYYFQCPCCESESPHKPTLQLAYEAAIHEEREEDSLSSIY